jgi:hypothetical protein
MTRAWTLISDSRDLTRGGGPDACLRIGPASRLPAMPDEGRREVSLVEFRRGQAAARAALWGRLETVQEVLAETSAVLRETTGLVDLARVRRCFACMV